MFIINDTNVFRTWLRKLKDPAGKVAVLRRIGRAQKGNFGDHKHVGEGVFEMRIPSGPGYRVYYMQTGDVVYLLLVGGDKSSQQKDIEKAQEMAAQIREESGDDQGSM